MPGLNQSDYHVRNSSEIFNSSVALGWKGGVFVAYTNATHAYAQFISLYPKENISKVFPNSEYGVNETPVKTKQYGEKTIAFSFVDEDNETGMNLAFYKGELMETLYVSGNNTADLEWFADKVYAKVQ